MDDYNMFKQALRGFDKDEVLAYIRRQEEESGARITSLERDIRKRDRIIAELKNRVVQKDEQVERLEKEIKSKYQKYIDNYRQIGELVYESRVKGDRIVADANAEADRILANADVEARRRVASVQGEVDAKLNEGKQQYLAVQDEMNEIVDLFNQMQKKFMQSYKEVHEIIQSMPASLDDMDLGLVEEEFDDSEALDEEDLDLTSLGISFSELDDTDEYDEDFRAELAALTEGSAGNADAAEAGFAEPPKETVEAAEDAASSAAGDAAEEVQAAAGDAEGLLASLRAESDGTGTAYFASEEAFAGTNAGELLGNGSEL